ncbi:MAG TPA: cytochrome c3 family protein [Nitrospirota bacterium]
MKIITTVIVSLCCILFSLPAIAEEGSPSPAAARGRKGPGLVKLDTLADIYRPVLFNHEKHTAIAGDCGICHHQHGKNASLPCHECHSLKASAFKSSATGSFMACKNCHGALDPAVPQMPGLKVAYHRQCFQCHRGMNDVGVSPKGCTQTCHDKRDTQKVAQKAGLKRNK